VLLLFDTPLRPYIFWKLNYEQESTADSVNAKYFNVFTSSYSFNTPRGTRNLYGF